MRGIYAHLARNPLLILGLVLLTLGANGVSVAAPLQASDLPDGMAGTTWQLDSMQNAPPDVVRPMQNGIIMTLVFDGKGNLSGQGACNGYFATYKVGANNAITLGPIGSTQKACAENLMNLDQQYFAALQSASKYNLYQAHLGLTTNNGSGILNYIGSGPPTVATPTPATAPTATPVTTTPPGGCTTFPETGKTVCGRFLQYWQGHGGLAQQGFPISEEIQETNDTDGKIYTVQYFERAVFEYHPENPSSSQVLLSLLGVFLYSQKYPQGAPGAVPNNEPGSVLFTETGYRLGGVFYQYWQSHGGLAQQGYPISNEFMEKSDLDGKTYKVQYFQRAVFEYHPELQPPYNVLLSQLGTFRYRAKYSSTLAQLSGSGNKVTSAFPLKPGLAVFRSVRAYDGYYYIDAYDPAKQQIGTIAAGSGPNDESAPVHIAADGMYALNVQGDGGWTVNVMQPKATYSLPPAHQEWKGHGWQASPLFSLKAGVAHFHAVSPNDKAVSSETPAKIDLLDQNGIQIGSFAEGSDPIDATADITIPADGVYILRIAIYQADWRITVDQ